jgi:hypothetical protein
LHWKHLQPRHHGRLGGILRRHQQARLFLRPRPQRHRQHPLDWPHRPVQRQFADHQKILELVRLNLFARRQHSDGNRQIEARPLLAHVRRCEIDGRPAHRKFEPGISQRGAHPVPRFLDRRIRQSDDDNQRLAPATVDFHFNRIRFDAIDSGRTDLG